MMDFTSMEVMVEQCENIYYGVLEEKLRLADIEKGQAAVDMYLECCRNPKNIPCHNLIYSVVGKCLVNHKIDECRIYFLSTVINKVIAHFKKAVEYSKTFTQKVVELIWNTICNDQEELQYLEFLSKLQISGMVAVEYVERRLNSEEMDEIKHFLKNYHDFLSVLYECVPDDEKFTKFYIPAPHFGAKIKRKRNSEKFTNLSCDEQFQNKNAAYLNKRKKPAPRDKNCPQDAEKRYSPIKEKAPKTECRHRITAFAAYCDAARTNTAENRRIQKMNKAFKATHIQEKLNKIAEHTMLDKQDVSFFACFFLYKMAKTPQTPNNIHSTTE